MGKSINGVLDQKDFIIAFVGFIGALVGGLLALLGSYLSNEFELNREKDQEIRELNSIIRGFHIELEMNLRRYSETAGKAVENLQPGQVLGFWWIQHDYFSTYTANSSKVGKIKSQEIQKEIIEAYTLLRGFIDSWRLNNILIQRYESALIADAQIKSRDPNNNQLADHLILTYKTLLEYTKTIKNEHQILLEKLSITLPRLEKYREK